MTSFQFYVGIAVLWGVMICAVWFVDNSVDKSAGEWHCELRTDRNIREDLIREDLIREKSWK